ncbi:MAG: hypothetical protein ACI4TI_02425, partial [Christensenellales bacterium]
MEEKKITYPFKNFVKNILLGIILILSIFCMVPVFNNVTNSADDVEEVVADGAATIYVYGYYSDGSFKELGMVTESIGFLWATKIKIYAYEYDNSRIYWTKDSGESDLDREWDYALGETHRQIPINGSETVYFVPETYSSSTEKRFSVVGVFEGKGISTSSNVVAMRTIETESAKLGATLKAGHTYTVLVCRDSIKLTLTNSARVNV